MTVAELIDKLKDFPPDMRVIMRDPEEYQHLEVKDVRGADVVPASGCDDEFVAFVPGSQPGDDLPPERVALLDYWFDP